METVTAYLLDTLSNQLQQPDSGLTEWLPILRSIRCLYPVSEAVKGSAATEQLKQIHAHISRHLDNQLEKKSVSPSDLLEINRDMLRL